jgi:hypothetical protein
MTREMAFVDDDNQTKKSKRRERTRGAREQRENGSNDSIRQEQENDARTEKCTFLLEEDQMPNANRQTTSHVEGRESTNQREPKEAWNGHTEERACI